MQNMFSRLIPLILLPLYFFLVAPSPAHAQYFASDLLGHIDANDLPIFTTSSVNNGSSTVNDRGFAGAHSGAVLDKVHHRLFSDDSNNHRVLVFNLDSNNNLIDHVADFVLGQSSFTTSTATTTQSGMNQPLGMAYDADGDRLFVSDSNNKRILIYNTATITNGMNATNVLGQTNFTSTTSTTSQSGFGTLGVFYGIAYDPLTSRLFVGDTSNRRILIFDAATSTLSNGMNAIGVLGQSNFTSSTVAVTQSGLSGIATLVYDASTSRLFAGDFSANRILVFNAATTTNGMNASNVLGQTSFTSSTTLGNTQNGLRGPIVLAVDSTTNRLFVSNYDASTPSISIFDIASITDGENAVGVLGQANFTSGTGGTSQSKIQRSTNGDYDPANNRLYFSDRFNARILIFNFVRLATSTLASGKASDSYSQSFSTTQSQGTVTYEVFNGSLPPGLATSTSGISGTPTTVGTYNFTIQATDNNGAIGYFVSQPQSYSITVGPAATVTVGNNNYAPASQPPVASTPTQTQPEPIFAINNIQLTTEVPVVITPATIPNSASIPSPIFTQNLKPADKKSDVQSLQQYLNSNGFLIAKAGSGSPGNETSFFGSLTKQALIKFQEAHANEILKPAGFTKGTGYFGPLTRAFVNSH